MSKDRMDEAKKILSLNDRGTYTVPTSSGLYPAQWNWDSCFAALGFAQYDEARAWTEISTLLSAQWPSGMVPHIVFHEDDQTYFPNSAVWSAGPSKRTSGITQPPIAAIALRRLYEEFGHEKSLPWLVKLLPKVLHWHRWFHEERDPERTGLVSVFHPWESGMDNSPMWDEALKRVPQAESVEHLRKDTSFSSASVRPRGDEYNRYLYLVFLFRQHQYDSRVLFPITPFRIADVGFNSILLRADLDLAYLLREIGTERDAEQVDLWAKSTSSALEQRWDAKDEFYYSLDTIPNTTIRMPGIGCFLPLFASDDLAKRRPELVRHMRRWLAGMKYGLPSFDPQAHEFEPIRYWRGPVWLVVNRMLIDGLRRNSLQDLADRLLHDSLELVDRSGFREYFDPRDGAGLGGENFSWTAAIYLSLCSLEKSKVK